MSSQIERRWGILTLAVLMFFVTVIVTQLNGAKSSIYYYIWIMVGYYAYKANLNNIITMMKIVIFINIGVLILVIVYMDDTTVGYLNNSKLDMIGGVIVMIIPKVFLYFYCNREIDKNQELSFDIKTNVNSNINTRNITENQIPIKKVFEIPIKNDEKLWEAAIKEYESSSRKKGLYAKIYVRKNGNEALTKVDYIKERFEQLKNEENENLKILESKRIEIAIKEKIYNSLPKGKCSNCSSIQLLTNNECLKCKAIFTSDSDYKLIKI
jgi:hypothetical protein